MSTVVLPDRESLVRRTAALRAEVKRRIWLRDPVLWAQERLGVTLWSKQREIMESVRDNRKTGVQSCHQAGKSFSAALLTLWWVDTHPLGEACVVTTAPTNDLVKTVLWAEIGKMHAHGKFPGRTTQKGWYITDKDGHEELVAFGRKPADNEPTGFQGKHKLYMLVIFDEADGIPKGLFVAGDSLLGNDNGRELDIGNPDNPTSQFAKNCKAGSGYNVIRISAFDTPRFTGEDVPELLDHLVGLKYVEEKRKAWAKDWVWTTANGHPSVCVPPLGKTVKDSDPLWQSKVLGLFPDLGGPQCLIPQLWIRQAQERELRRQGERRFGVDVGAGGDSSTVAEADGPVVRVIHDDKNPNTMETCGNVLELRRKHRPAKIRIDKIGIGKGLFDRMVEVVKAEPNRDKIAVQGVCVGDAARDTEQFANLRAENWWGVRLRFEEGDVDIDPQDDELAQELGDLRYFRNSRGQIQIESKADALRRGVPSPNRADAAMLALCPDPSNEVEQVSWGAFQ